MSEKRRASDTEGDRELFETLSREELIDKLVEYDVMLKGLLSSKRVEAAFQKRRRETDDLTRILNRPGLRSSYNDRLRHRGREEDRAKPDLVAMIDLDKFKEINDSAGHAAGDFALRSVAQLIRENVRRDDIVGRYGGDEFMVMLLNATLDEGNKIGEKIRRQAEAANLASPSSQPLPTLSIGIAEIDYGLSFSKMYHAADLAMYAAKGAGRNQVHILQPGGEK